MMKPNPPKGEDNRAPTSTKKGPGRVHKAGIAKMPKKHGWKRSFK